MPAITLLRQHPRTLLLTVAPCRSPWPPPSTTSAYATNWPSPAATNSPDSPAATLTDRAEQLLTNHRHPGDLMVLLLDANDFMAVNDLYGHAAGDQVLVAIGQRLRVWAAAHRGLAARLDGDEFVALAHIPRADAHLRVSVSIGAAYATDLPGRPWTDVLRAADTAMYRVKTGEAPFP
jgi:GGDEF domain-containing protein